MQLRKPLKVLNEKEAPLSYRCDMCGVALKHSTTCNTCFSRKLYIIERNRARKAKIIEDNGQPVWNPRNEGDWDDGYSSSLDAALEYWYDQHEDGEEPPFFVFCTRENIPKINIHRLVEELGDKSGLDDFNPDELPKMESLYKAIEDFNQAQAPTSWDVDYSRLIVIDPIRFERYLNEDKDGNPDIRYQTED